MTEGTRTTVRGRTVDHSLQTPNLALLTARSKQEKSLLPTVRSIRSASSLGVPHPRSGWGVAITDVYARRNRLLGPRLL